MAPGSVWRPGQPIHLWDGPGGFVAPGSRTVAIVDAGEPMVLVAVVRDGRAGWSSLLVSGRGTGWSVIPNVREGS